MPLVKRHLNKNDPTLRLPPATHSSSPPGCGCGPLCPHLRHQCQSGNSQPCQDRHAVSLCEWVQRLVVRMPFICSASLLCPTCRYNFKHDCHPHDENTRTFLREALDQYDAEKKRQMGPLKAVGHAVDALDRLGIELEGKKTGPVAAVSNHVDIA